MPFLIFSNIFAVCRDHNIEAFTSSRCVPERVTQWRLNYFRRQLYEITYSHFLKTRADMRDMSPELCEDMGLDSDDEEGDIALGRWPEYFEVN